MGKCTKKAKMTADVPLTDVSQSYLGVRTHTKTLALHRLPSAAAAASTRPEVCYLELRSRRLEKPMQPQNSRRSYGSRGKADAGIGRHEDLSPPASTEAEGLGIEASFGENNLDSDVRERGAQESTPCSSTGTITTTKQACSSPRIQDALVRIAPPAHELEEFFAREEQSVQGRFVDKYNFDIVRDLPLRGRYEWVEVMPVRP